MQALRQAPSGSSGTNNGSFYRKIHKELLNSIQLQYDPDVKTGNLASDGQSRRGGFILYHGSPAGQSSRARKITCTEIFKKFVISCITEVFAKVPTTDIIEALKKI